MNKLHTYLTLALLFLLGSALQAQDLDKLSEYIEDARKKFEIPGMAVGIVKDGKVVFQKGFGLKEAGKTEAVDENTLFAIASVSKAFTVAGLGMLVDEGRIGWKDQVITHLPYFGLHDPYVTSLITVEDLTCHRSGLATFDGDLLWYGTDYSSNEILQRIGKLPLKRTFRVDYGYQNIMYIAAGQVIEEVTSQSWGQYIQNSIFDKLDMRHSLISTKQFTPKTNYARPHLEGEKIDLLNYDNAAAAAGINSSVADMCKWIQFWLNDCTVEGDTLLSPSTKRKIFQSHTVMGTGRFDEQNGTYFKAYGMGWSLKDYKGMKVAHHGGGLPGYISRIALVPEQNLGMIILSNDMSNLPSALANKIIDYFTNNGDKDWASLYAGYYKNYQERLKKKREHRQAGKVEGTVMSHPAAAYSGKYSDKMYGVAQVNLDGNKLYLTLNPTKELFTGELVHWHYDTFQVQFKDPFLPPGLITFDLNEKGNVAGFKIDLPNPDFHFFNLDFRKN